MQGKMENGSAYGGNPLPASAHLHPHHHGHHPASTAAALVAFSQANSQALGEALRLSSQRPFPQAEAAAAAAAAAYHNLPLLHHLHQQNPHFFAAGHQLGSLSALGAAGAGQFAGAGAFRPLTPSEAAFAGLGPANAHGLGAAPPPTTKGPCTATSKDGLPFNLSRYNPLFTSISSMAESSVPAGRLLFTGGQRGPATSSASPPAGHGSGGVNNNHNNHLSNNNSNNNNNNPSPAAGEERESAATPSSDVSANGRSTPDDVHNVHRRKKSPLDPSCCPVCGVTLRPSDLEAHFIQEIERLERVSRSSRLAACSPALPSGSSVGANQSTSHILRRDQDSRWETFHRIRMNRTNRVRAKARKRRADERDDAVAQCSPGTVSGTGAGGSTATPCPICGEKLYGSAEELNLHVVHCLRRNGDDADDDDEPLDVEGDSYEEYEWAGQRRVRASSMLQGGFGGVGMLVCKTQNHDEETEEVVVDGDDTATFGPTQYAESDVAAAAGAAEPSPQDQGREHSPDGRESPTGDVKPALDNGSKDHVIRALKTRIHDLEELNREAKQKYRCLICLGDYRQPVVSTSCWHVHCEECWLQALGSKKLCPQCNLITSPTHLRRIYV